MSKIFKASLIIGISFGINKLLALARQYIIAKQFGLGPEIDAFNVANNMPDLIFSLFSGGALAMAFIPIFAEYLDIHGIDISWKLFSKVATILFVGTALVSIIISITAPLLVAGELGIAPGFSESQQALVVALLRINLVATLIFSMSGLATASLQAHKHFLLPAIAPIFYNLGIIFGAVVLTPSLGIYGLTYGVVIGAVLHLLIQIPGMFYYKFRLSLSINLNDPGVRRVFRLMGPRILTVFLIQITFLLRDNFASRLETGAVSALTYGYFIMQVPETLIGSSLAIALLPTLSSHMSSLKQKEFAQVLSLAVRILIAASILPMVLVFVAAAPLISLVFHFSYEQAQLLTWTTNAFMAGLVGHVLLEVFVRAFYAQQKVKIPLMATLVRTIVFVILGSALYKSAGAVGIAAIDSFSVIVEAVILFFLLLPYISQKLSIGWTVVKSVVGGAVALGVVLAVLSVLHIPLIIQISVALLLATGVYFFFIIQEVKLLVKL